MENLLGRVNTNCMFEHPSTNLLHYKKGPEIEVESEYFGLIVTELSPRALTDDMKVLGYSWLWA